MFQMQQGLYERNWIAYTLYSLWVCTMTTGINIVRVAWGADPGYKKELKLGLFQNRLVLQDEVLGLVKELINTEFLGKRPKDYEYIGWRKGFWIKVDTVEPEYIDNEKWQGKLIND